jgi:3',5'-cyclic AMP phosphodiesterase CpdA
MSGSGHPWAKKMRRWVLAFLGLASCVVAGCSEVPANLPEGVSHLKAASDPVSPIVDAASLPADAEFVANKLPTTVAPQLPTVRPDRILLTWTGDPARSQAVTWRTETSVAVGLAEIAVAGDNAEFAKRARQLKASTTFLKTDVASAHYHTVEFAALSPQTKYAYRVGDGRTWSEWFHFTTASDQAEPFSFVYFGDAQNDLKSMWSRVVREAFFDAPDARFLLHAGDLVNNCSRDAEWGEWFHAGGWLNAMIPSIATPGNHEYQRTGMTLASGLTDRWRPQFAFPENGPAELAETVYFLDYQGVRIISLNSNEKQAEQIPWLESALKSNPCRWTIITFHHPIYSSAKSRDNAKLRALWQPVLDKYRVDLVLQGHDHTYARSGLVDAQANLVADANEPVGVTGRSESGGTVYVVSVSGPKMYDLDKPYRPQFQRVAEDVQLFQIISIDGDDLHYEARTVTGTRYDGFTLKKRDGLPNELIEQIPSTPQRVRPPKAKPPNPDVRALQ